MAGTVIIEVPIVGTKEAIPATTAQIIALGTPKNTNPAQARMAWAIAIINEPLNILSIDFLKFVVTSIK